MSSPPTPFTPEQLRRAVDLLPSLEPSQREEMAEVIEGLLEDAQKARCREEFIPFVKRMWPGFIAGAHHQKIADVFERVARGELKRVCISLPPRSTKSEFSSYLFPAWFLGKYPDKQVLQASHKAELAVGFGRKLRNLLDTPGYKEVFPDVILRADSKAAGRWNTGNGGSYYAAGVGAGLAGFGGDLVIIDDPHDEQEAMHGQHDPEVFNKAFEWYQTGPRQRLQPGAAIVVIHTRWSKIDLIGRLIDAQVKDPQAEQWEVIEFPAILPSGRSYWPEYWKLEELLATKRAIPPLRWNAQYMQALAVDTPIPTPTGWTTMGDLRPGDLVIGSDGLPTRVVRATEPAMSERCFKVTSDDGAHVIADEGHLWTLKGRNDGWFRTKTTAKWVERQSKGRRRPKPPEVPAWDLPDADLPLDPWVLGCWLGDGNTGGAVMNGHDDDAVFMRAEFERRGFPTTDHTKHQSWGVLGGLRTKLRLLGILDRKAIPPEYLRGSRLQRLELLQGLMDTDGTVAERGQCYFASVREDFANAVVELVLSLGGKPFKRICPHKSPRTGELSQHYRVFFYLEDAFRMPRKAARARARQTKIGRFLSFEEVAPVEVVCISVEAKDGLFLAGRGCLLTHNSPTGEEGAILKRQWWVDWRGRSLPDQSTIDFRIQAWDTAGRQNQRSDYSVCTTWDVFYENGSPKLIPVHIFKDRLEYPELKAMAKKLYADLQPDSIIIEAKNAGDALFQELRRVIPVQGYTPSRGAGGGDKIARANAVADIFASGMVYKPPERLVPGIDDLVEELAAFPHGSHDDQVDSSVLALTRFRQGNFIRLHSDEDENGDDVDQWKANYYL